MQWAGFFVCNAIHRRQRKCVARSFVPALLVGGEALAKVWVFLPALLVGGVLAALVYGFLEGKKEN